MQRVLYPRSDVHASRIGRSPIGGMTLIELMIVVIVVAILAAIAVPSFQDQIRKSRRSDAIESITRVERAQEKFRASHTTYASSLTALGFPSDPFTSGDGYYRIYLSQTSDTGYKVEARPIDGTSQANDSSCLPSTWVTVTAGAISHGPVDDCWNR